MYRKILPLLALLTLLASPFAPAPVAAAPDWQAKVDPQVLETAAQGEVEFLIFLTAQADLSGATELITKEEKGAFVYASLVETALRTQAPLLAALQRMDVPHESLWVANMIWARGDQATIQSIAQRADVAHLYANPHIQLDAPVFSSRTVESSLGVEWNIARVRAPEVWAAGYTGQGVVIGGADTGYDWDHPAIKDQYRGWDGAVASHDYNWHDATGLSPTQPVDPYWHGTHTMGTMVGDDGGSNQIGMAPGARWIGCRNMNNSGYGTPATYSECYQWFIAPWPIGGDPFTDGDPAMAPDVINNSWACLTSEGCSADDPEILLEVVQNVRAAGILTVHSAGNSGSACATVNTPAAIYAESFSVGATDSSDAIAGFSSRGPVTFDGSNRRKPDISAPGVGIRSCIPGTGYSSSNGTSMAAPHVAGLAALLISAAPDLSGQVERLETLIEHSAVPITTTQGCGGDSVTDIPNHVYGWGRIDAWNAYQSMYSFELGKHASLSQVIPGALLTYTLAVTNTGYAAVDHLVITDVVPLATEFLTATLPHTHTGSLLTWHFPSLAAGQVQQVSLQVQVTLTATGTITNADYRASSDQTLPIKGLPVTTEVLPTTLLLSKTAPERVAPGGLLTYTLSVTNPHPFAVQNNLVLTDVLPGDVAFVRATAPYTLSGNTITWQQASLASGALWQVDLVVQAPLTFTGTLTNASYQVRSDETTPVFGLPVLTHIYALAVGKAAVAWVAPGDYLTYTLTVTNLHPSQDVHQVWLEDPLPPGVTFATASEGYTLQDGVLRWELGTLAPGESLSRQMVVWIPPGMQGSVVNQGYTVTGQELGEPVWGKPVTTCIYYLHYWPIALR
ncbi:MAG: S8 family serine peptidase [Anaerolineales bacterium]|nr:S8 family serine peptidase [Anaerolineales bacterium]